MSRTLSRWRRNTPLIATLLLTGALGGCSGQGAPDAAPSDSGSAAADAVPQTLPLTTTGPAPQTIAPPVTALPTGRTIGLRRLANRQQGYGWLDRANYQEEAVEDAPPDYGFDQDGVRPWTWATGDGARVISEPVAGGYRTYYYEAGAQQPYLVRDPSYAYAYENGALVGVFTLAGVLLDPVAGSAQAGYGARYFDRGANLWRAARTAPHQSVNAYAWGDARADLSAQRVTWQAHVADNPDWSAWNSAHAPAERSRWDTARARHQQAAQQFGTWQRQKFQGPPPQFYSDTNRAEPERPDHGAAVAGGVIAAGVAATAAHAALTHHPVPPPPEARPVPPVPTRQPGPAPVPQRPATGPDHGHPAPGNGPHAEPAMPHRSGRPDTAPPQAIEHPAQRPVAQPPAAPHARTGPAVPPQHEVGPNASTRPAHTAAPPSAPRPEKPQDHASPAAHEHGDPHRQR